MSKLTPWDGFETKKAALRHKKQLKNDKRYPVQHVQIKKTAGRLKYTVYIGGRNSHYW
jgi:hypothetical protein